MRLKNTFSVKKNSLKTLKLLENLFFCCDTADIRSRACSPGWKMKHSVFMGNLEHYMQTCMAMSNTVSCYITIRSDLMKRNDGRFCPLCCHYFWANNFSSRGKELGKYKKESSSVPPPLKTQINQERERLVLRGKWVTHFVHEKPGFLCPAAAPVRTPGLKGPVLGSPVGERWRCSAKKMQLAGWGLWPSVYSWRLPLTAVGEDLQGFWIRLMSL